MTDDTGGHAALADRVSAMREKLDDIITNRSRLSTGGQATEIATLVALHFSLFAEVEQALRKDSPQ